MAPRLCGRIRALTDVGGQSGITRLVQTEHRRRRIVFVVEVRADTRSDRDLSGGDGEVDNTSSPNAYLPSPAGPFRAETEDSALQGSEAIRTRHVNPNHSRDCGIQVLLIPNPHVVPTLDSPPHPPFLLPYFHVHSVTETPAATARARVSEETDPPSSCLVACL